MPSNDQIILEQVLSRTREDVAESFSESKFFELFSAEQILKDYDLSYDEIESGILGGSHDGGIDSVYCFVNGELIEEDTDLSGFKKDVSLDLIFIQSKKSPSFSESTIEKLATSTAELLDLSRPLSELLGEYNKELIEKITLFRKAYEELAVKFPKASFKYYYATTATEVHPNVRKKSGIIVDLIAKLFSSAEIEFDFVGAPELLQLARKTPKTTYVLKLSENPITSSGAIGFVCLVRLKDYFNFITDENDNIHKNIFEANVRDYQGEVQVNAAIQNSLKKGDDQEDFWWLNNGVTIIASNAAQSGKAITVENPSVVNGLQTSTEVFKYFKESNTEGDDRQLQVKILVPEFVESRDRIIKATNSQTSIPSASLRATEKIHRDIEEYLRPYKIYYDRRKNYYKNQGKPIDQIISIGRLSQAVMSILLGRPNDARARPSSLLKDDDDYMAVFNPNYNIDLYRICATILEKVEAFLKLDELALETRDRNNTKFHLAMYAAMRAGGKAKLGVADITSLDIQSFDSEFLSKCFEKVWELYCDLGGDDRAAKGIDFPHELILDVSGE